MSQREFCVVASNVHPLLPTRVGAKARDRRAAGGREGGRVWHCMRGWVGGGGAVRSRIKIRAG